MYQMIAKSCSFLPDHLKVWCIFLHQNKAVISHYVVKINVVLGSLKVITCSMAGFVVIKICILVGKEAKVMYTLEWKYIVKEQQRYQLLWSFINFCIAWKVELKLWHQEVKWQRRSWTITKALISFIDCSHLSARCN